MTLIGETMCSHKLLTSWGRICVHRTALPDFIWYRFHWPLAFLWNTPLTRFRCSGLICINTTFLSVLKMLFKVKQYRCNKVAAAIDSCRVQNLLHQTFSRCLTSSLSVTLSVSTCVVAWRMFPEQCSNILHESLTRPRSFTASIFTLVFATDAHLSRERNAVLWN